MILRNKFKLFKNFKYCNILKPLDASLHNLLLHIRNIFFSADKIAKLKKLCFSGCNFRFEGQFRKEPQKAGRFLIGFFQTAGKLICVNNWLDD